MTARVSGSESVYVDSDLLDLEIAGLALKPLDLAWDEFIVTLGEALRVPQILDWLSARLR